MDATLKRDEVQRYLEEFHVKMKVFGIIFRDDRGKNQEALEKLDIRPGERRSIIEALRVEDYVAGPVDDMLNKMGAMWVFGKVVKGHEIYIKIMISPFGEQTICISFHLAEFPMKYPFKEK